MPKKFYLKYFPEGSNTLAIHIGKNYSEKKGDCFVRASVKKRGSAKYTEAMTLSEAKQFITNADSLGFSIKRCLGLVIMDRNYEKISFNNPIVFNS